MQLAFMSTPNIRTVTPARVLLGKPRNARLPVRPTRGSAKHIVASATDDLPSIGSISQQTFINEDGWVRPKTVPNAAATVFAVFNEDRHLQYVGFSKCLRNSLRTMLFRRPELCYYYKSFDLTELDQQRMLAIRTEWFNEMGNPPPGNTDKKEMELWQKAPEFKSRELAEASAAETLQKLADERGLKEHFEVDTDQLARFKLELIGSDVTSEEDLKKMKEAEESKKAISVEIDGKEVEFTIGFGASMKTNGGWMFEITVTSDGLDSTHRVIVNKMYSDAASLDPKDLATMAFAFLLRKGVHRQTEGMRNSDEFPINYFAISEVEMWWPEFGTMMKLPSDNAERWGWWWKLGEGDMKFLAESAVAESTAENNAVKREAPVKTHEEDLIA